MKALSLCLALGLSLFLGMSSLSLAADPLVCDNGKKTVAAVLQESAGHTVVTMTEMSLIAATARVVVADLGPPPANWPPLSGAAKVLLISGARMQVAFFDSDGCGIGSGTISLQATTAIARLLDDI